MAGAGEGLETFVTGCYDGCLRVYGPGCKVSGSFPPVLSLLIAPCFCDCLPIKVVQRGTYIRYIWISQRDLEPFVLRFSRQGETQENEPPPRPHFFLWSR